MTTSRIEPFFEYKFPNKEYIFVQQEGQIRRPMSVDEFNRQFGVSIKHGVFYESEQADRIKIAKEAMRKAASKYEKNNQELLSSSYLQNPKNYFSVCYLDDACGYGLVANEDIPAETVVGTYSGLLVMREKNEDMAPLKEREYDMGYGELCPVKFGDKSYSLTLRAKNVSDITRFAIHLPTQIELSKLKNQLAEDINPSNVMTANIDFPIAIIDGAPIHYYKTTQLIKKGEVAGISYGPTYWNSRAQPHLLIRETDCLRIAIYDEQSGFYKKSNGIQVKINDSVTSLSQAASSYSFSQPTPPVHTSLSPKNKVDTKHEDQSAASSQHRLMNSSAQIRLALLRPTHRRQQTHTLKPAPIVAPTLATSNNSEETAHSAFKQLQKRRVTLRIQPGKIAADNAIKPRWRV